jgi:hypothetical protein
VRLNRGAEGLIIRPTRKPMGADGGRSMASLTSAGWTGHKYVVLCSCGLSCRHRRATAAMLAFERHLRAAAMQKRPADTLAAPKQQATRRSEHRAGPDQAKVKRERRVHELKVNNHRRGPIGKCTGCGWSMQNRSLEAIEAIYRSHIG